MSSVLANEQVNLEDGNSLAQTQYRHMESPGEPHSFSQDPFPFIPFTLT